MDFVKATINNEHIALKVLRRIASVSLVSIPTTLLVSFVSQGNLTGVFLVMLMGLTGGIEKVIRDYVNSIRD